MMEIKTDVAQSTIANSMLYTYSNRGKQVRSNLVYMMTKALGGSLKAAKIVGDAIESIHAYSLIHDDLPCMDDDTMRRGKLCNHKVYGEGMATLAGDALQTFAFEILSSDELVCLIGSDKAIKLVKSLSNAAGYLGMCGGQCLDIEADNKRLSFEEFKHLVSLKTGALFNTSIECACIICGINTELTDKAKKFSNLMGEAFQVTDDILDYGENKVNTYISFLGLEKAKKYEQELYEECLKILDEICPQNNELKEYILKISKRKN